MLTRAASMVLALGLTVPAAIAQPAEPDAGDYRIGIEDQLRISVWGEPELNLTVSVRPDGRITFPLVNDYRVAGRTPDEVRAGIAERLSAYVRDPNVTVIVEAINSFKIYVLGEVNSQGVFNLYRPTRVLQAVAIAGGFTEFAKKQITLFRDHQGEESRVSVNYKRLAAGEAGEANLYLQPGDTLIVD